MASERDREIWDDATNAVCQAMQEQKMCNCPDGDCLAAKIDFSPEKIATATRPAPAATDTGLVTVAFQHRRIDKYGVVGDWRPYKRDLFGSDRIESRELVTRSQAEELLAAERAKTERWHKKAMDAGVIVHSDGTTSHPMRKELDDLKTDNAAKDARVKELEADVKREAQSSTHNAQDCLDEQLRAEALEAKLAAAEKALEPFAEYCGDHFDKDFDGNPLPDEQKVGWIYLNYGHFRKARAVLGGKP